VVWSIPIIIVLVYLLYYTFRAKEISNLCFDYCGRGIALGYKVDGDLWHAFILDESKMYCLCYYSFINGFVNRSIGEIRQLRRIGGELSGEGIILPFG